MIRWSNLWNQFRLAPGTRRARILLSLWQVWLMLASGGGALLAGVLGLGMGFFVAWVSHELLFMWYAEKVAGVPEMDRFPYAKPYTHPSYVPTIERWTGPFGSDPRNEKVG